MADILLAKNLGIADPLGLLNLLKSSIPAGEFKPKEIDLLISKAGFKVVVHFKLEDELSLT